MAGEATSIDGLLNGRLRLRQPRRGHRFGAEAVLLAAAVPAADDECALDVGCGVGAVALALAWRCPRVEICGLEREADLAALATANAAANGLDARVRFVRGDLGDGPAGLPRGGFDHVVSNPPFFAEARVRVSDDPRRARAHSAGPGDLDWIGWLRHCLDVCRDGGSLTVLLRAERLGETLAALAPGAGAIRLLPLWPDRGRDARQIIVQARKGSRAPLALRPGLVLHEGGDGYGAAAERILRDGAALDLG